MEIESPEKRLVSPVKEERKSATRNQRATPSVNESRHQLSPSPFKIPKASGKASVGTSSTLRKLTVFGDAPHGHATNGATDQFMYPSPTYHNSEDIGNNSADLIEFKGKGRGKLSFWQAVRVSNNSNGMVNTYGFAGRSGNWQALEINTNVSLIRVSKTVDSICEIELCSIREGKSDESLSKAINDTDKTDASIYEYTIYDQEMIVGVYGSFDAEDKHITSLGFIISKRQ